MKKTNWSWIKTFAYLVVASVALYILLRIVTAVFDIDTNIDTGNSVLSILYYADYALFAAAVLGLIVAVLGKLLKKLF